MKTIFLITMMLVSACATVPEMFGYDQTEGMPQYRWEYSGKTLDEAQAQTNKCRMGSLQVPVRRRPGVIDTADRNAYFNSCMRAEGFTLTQVEEIKK